MDNRRIALLSECAGPETLMSGVAGGSPCIYVDELSRQLSDHGYEVDILTRWETPDTPEILPWAPGVRIVALQVGPPGLPGDEALTALLPGFRDAVIRFMLHDGARYDLIHGTSWPTGWVASELRRTLDRPAVGLIHSQGEPHRERETPSATPHQRAAVEGTDRLIARSPAEREELVMEYGAAPHGVSVISAGVNVHHFRPVDHAQARSVLNLDGDGPVVVYAGRFLAHKDIRNIVQAVAMLRDELPIRLLLVGGDSPEPNAASTPEIGVLERLAMDLGIADRVHFTGWRQQDTLWLYYGAADVAVSTPWYEPVGLGAIEAMACGRPVIASDVGGLSTSVHHGRTGFLVPPGNPDALADRLRRLLGDHDLRRRMGIDGRTQVERESTWQRVTQRTVALYEELLTRHEVEVRPRRVLDASSEENHVVGSPR